LGVEKLAAQFGGKIQLMPHFVMHARRDAVEEAIGRMMHTTAFAMADRDCRPVPAKAIVEKREELERARLQASALPSTSVNEAYLGWVDQFLAIQAPLSDPIVERRPADAKRPRP
jgi:hypothetical protein